MNCPFPHCVKEEFHDGKHETRRFTRLLESGKLMFAICRSLRLCRLLGCHALLARYVLALPYGWHMVRALQNHGD
jgi:hypothetical protein